MRTAEPLRGRRPFLQAVCALVLLGITSCSLPPLAGWHRPSMPPTVEVGIASWYGPGFHGNRTSSGERYNQHSQTAAHPTLPLGSRVRVTNLENGRAVELRINDRGPFVEGRIIDVSFAAARSLGMITPGTARVSVERLDGGSKAGLRVAWAVQAGAFENEMRARELHVSLAERYRDVYVMPYESARATVHRVRVGPFSAHGDAIRRAAEINRLGLRPLVVEEVVR